MEKQKEVVQETENIDEDKTKENVETETPEQNDEGQSLETETPEQDNSQKVEKEKPNDEVDYKAELEKAKSIISHKEKIIQTEKLKRKQLESQTIDKDDEDDSIDDSKLRQDEELNKFKMSVLEDKIEDEVLNLAKSDDEADLIRFHLKNTVKFGYTVKEIKEAVKTAWLKANEKRILNTNKELAEALKSKSTSLKTQSSSGQPINRSKKEYSESEKKFLRTYGVEV